MGSIRAHLDHARHGRFEGDQGGRGRGVGGHKMCRAPPCRRSGRAFPLPCSRASPWTRFRPSSSAMSRWVGMRVPGPQGAVGDVPFDGVSQRHVERAFCLDDQGGIYCHANNIFIDATQCQSYPECSQNPEAKEYEYESGILRRLRNVRHRHDRDARRGQPVP